jgi:hypothetical protein
LKKYNADEGEIKQPVHAPDEWWFRNNDAWNRENQDVKDMARELHTEYQRKVMRRQNVYAMYVNGEPDQNKAKIYAMIACLRRFRFDPSHRSWFVVQRDGIPEYKAIDAKLVRQMETMIQGLAKTDEFKNREEYEYFKFDKWEMMGFEFEENLPAQKKPVRQRKKKTVGFYPYINLGEEDMTKFGIYNEFNADNYKRSCVIETFASVLNSSEVAMLESIMQSWTCPINEFIHISELFGLKIWVHHMDKRIQPPIVPRDDKWKTYRKKMRVIDVLVIENHLTIWEAGLEAKIEGLTLREMTNEEYNIAAQQFARKREMMAVGYPDCAKRPWETWNGEQGGWKEDTPIEFDNLMSKKFGMDVKKYKSMAQMAFALLQKHVKGVFELRGHAMDFIRECLHPAILGAPYDKYPLEVVEDLVQLDQNGSYAAAYANFDGIPKGVPCFIKDWEATKRDATHYYVRVDVKSFKCKHREDPYPIVSVGTQFWDKIWLEMVEEHYDVDYQFISGYQFVHGCASIKEITEELWALRNTVKGKPEEQFVKMVMNTWWGRSVSSHKIVTETLVRPQNLQGFIRTHPLVYSHRRDGAMVRVRTLRPIVAAWQMPQFGVNVECWARRKLQDTIYKLIDAGENMWYSNTDSLIIRPRAMGLVNIGRGLGEFKIEHEGVRFICLGPKTRVLVGKNGELWNTWGKPSIEWFEMKMRKLLQK